MTDEQINEDDFIERTLRSLEDDSAPVNMKLITQAVEKAQESFPAPAAAQKNPNTNKKTFEHGFGSGPMFAIGKPFAVLATSAVLLLLALLTDPGTATADITLGRVLDLAAKSDSLQIEVVCEGKTADVLVSGNWIRWQDAAKRYRIAKGSRLWKIDESTQEVAESNNPWIGKGGHIDLISMLGNVSSDELRSTRPSRQTEHAGCLCNVFQFKAPKGQPVIRAFANAKTNELYSIAAFAPDVKVGRGVPLAELRLVARNIEIDESKFVVGSDLSQDSRAGVLQDAQGIVQLRPKTSRRWTLVTGRMLVKSGDWVRTDVRGANAAAVALTSGHKLTVGPGSLLQIDDANRVLLHRGEVRVTPGRPSEAALQLTGPNHQIVEFHDDKPRHVRLDRNRQVVDVLSKPLWLAGFEGTSGNESLGSLIANIDGRNTPLTVGFHRVKVEIRDQIARTTIEESFVNHTKNRLEGVFHFPLPQDASISGFGMWIGGELIEADVVEKQRAREIYETILRERRDPGLLEWAGGNIFKARVFPIEAHSEKRIKIVYTQVLPMRANRYRYSYGLRSEMLQKTPLRELSLEVLVHSALKLKSVTCPTHAVRSELTGHSARLEFTAQEHTPGRDFEVVCEVDAQDSDVVVVPHRRGDDGYFLAQVTPPAPAGNWQREILPDGQPLNLMVVCDTSGSMNSDTRDQQKQFVSALLSSLSDHDRFSVGVCDVQTQWRSNDPAAVDEQSVDAAVNWLERRRSLGWTDLDQMLESVAGRLRSSAPDNTHVIYIGDGVVTARDADPQAFANRLHHVTKDLSGATFHAVSIGSSFESTVLKSIASIGGGSVRQIDGEQTPQRIAHELLNEMAQPGLRNLKVEFHGIQVAAVYPAELPNLAAGTQQILIGRYLPTGENQTGQIVVTGTRHGEPVRYSSRITLADAETGNSFVPRLWARSHLDHLLQQGSSEFLKDEIISLSEEFHIMTPYTSLLVLETDADRERFGVKRRFLMRDGEKFFANGRSEASFELLQQQMKAAGNWRLGMRRKILSQLAGLGRDISLFSSHDHMLKQVPGRYWHGRTVSVSGAISRSLADGGFGDDYSRPGSAGFGGKLRDLHVSGSSPFSAVGDRLETVTGLSAYDELADAGRLRNSPVTNGPGIWAAAKDAELADQEFELDTVSAKLFAQEMVAGFKAKLAGDVAFDSFALRQQPAQFGWTSAGLLGRKGQANLSAAQPYWGRSVSFRSDRRSGSRVDWLNQLIPGLPAAPPVSDEKDSAWPEKAARLAASLVQPLKLSEGSGVEVRLDTEYIDARWNRTTSRNTTVALSAADRWLTTSQAINSNNLVNWCTKDIRAVYSTAFRLGRQRTAKHTDVTSMQPGNRPFATESVEKIYRTYSAEVTEDGDEQSVLVLTAPDQTSGRKLFITIDTNRSVVVKSEWKQNGSTTGWTEYTDYVQVAGCWWPQKLQQQGADGQVTSTTRQKVSVRAANAFAEKFKKLLPEKDVLLLPAGLPSLRAARIAADNGSADIADLIVLMIDAAEIQDWESVLRLLEKVDLAAGNRPGMNWLRLAVLRSARKNETLRLLAVTLLEELAQTPSIDDLFLVNHVVNRTSGVADANEQLALLDTAKPVFQRQPKHIGAAETWKRNRAVSLHQLNRTAESVLLYREIAEKQPWNYSAQTTYAQQLAEIGEHGQAMKWLRKEIDRDVKRQPHEIQQLRQKYANLLRQKHLVDELVVFTTEWIQKEPEDQNACDQHLAALRSANRPEAADEQAAQWLSLAESALPEAGRTATDADAGQDRMEGKLTSAELARLNAAISYALGHVFNSYQNYIDPQWHKPLADAAIALMKNPHHFSAAGRIASDHRFNRTDQVRRIRTEAAQQLRRSAADLHPARFGGLLGHTLSEDDLNQKDWSEIANTLRKRWDGENNDGLRDEFGVALARLYSYKFPDSHYLPFLRDRIERETAEERPQAADQLRQKLFEVLLTRPWTTEIEAEAFSLLPKLQQSQDSSLAMFARVPALYRLVDRMIQVMVQIEEKKLQTDGHPEELTRTELAARRKTFRVNASKATASRLSQEAKRLSADGDTQALADWMQMERMHLEIQLADHADEANGINAADLKQKVRSECRKILGSAPIKSEADNDGRERELQEQSPDPAEQQRFILQSLLQDRAFVMASNLALRRNAPEGDADRILNYIDRGITQGEPATTVWKSRRITMLIALDQPQPLENSLRQWIRDDDYAGPYQLLLARLLAEQGRIAEAIALFETVRRKQTLAPEDYAALADWYMFADRKEDYRRARIEVFKATEEWRLRQWIQQKQQRWNNAGITLPTELDEEVLLAFQALFEKSANPGNYVSLLKNFYTACRDFRLLNMVSDAVVGRTRQQIYPFLTQLNSNLLVEVRNEATADELMAGLTKTRETAEAPVDRRALDLLEAMIERRSANVLNQPGPHIDAAVAAMKRAFSREWADGEVLQMAAFLRDMGTIRHPKLADERRRQLKALHSMAAPGTDDRFNIAWMLSYSLFHSHNERENALALMGNALAEFRTAHRGGLPARLNESFDGYIGLLRTANRFAEAELLLQREITNPINLSQQFHLKHRLNELYHDALKNKAQVSLGSGKELYVNLLQRLLHESAINNDSYRYQCMTMIVDVFRTMTGQPQYEDRSHVRKYAFEQFPVLLDDRAQNYRSLMQQTADIVSLLLGDQAGIEFLVDRIENYPARFKDTYENPWRQYSSRLAQWRHNVKRLPADLETRLLRIVLAELRRDLTTRRQHNRSLFNKNSSYFWAEKAGDFASTANRIASENAESGGTITHVAEFFYSSLREHNRAIEMMFEAHDRHVLDVSQQHKLIQWLFNHNRHAESIPLLKPLVEGYPNEINNRTLLITAYTRTGRNRQAKKLLADAEEHFRQPGRWTESNLASLALCCRENSLMEDAVRFYREVIPLHQRSQPGRGIGNGTLSGYYNNLSQAHSGLGNTIEAVDAAASAIISWGPRHRQRSNAVSQLESVLSSAKDLDDYVEHLNRESQNSGTDSPVIRKALGRVFAGRKSHEKAIEQLKIAIELQPTDAETHTALTASYMATEQKDAAVSQMLAQLNFDRHNLPVYEALARQLADDEDQSERAATTIVEAAPLEASHHRSLAELRERQKRWPDAIRHWQHVAELRSLEPTGLIKLAEAQIKAERFTAATRTITRLSQKTWPDRFGDTRQEVRRLEKLIP